ncbi:DUF3168 domain-containing protein [Martelella lutilitoris]|uniref:DUF3168 domain-containing protein n=1 Tax=Martelella lutilitoris TaxID=2583532 RepID=A0A5C4JML4_9HYPH|nr:DUF3168 domain-containing protein [Martelella lutilitoris]TNB46441.1 DUF3168 domain-containing protein [Martelella lutilitoris]
MSAELALQKAIRDRLTTSGSVTALVPEENILDRNQRPAPDPSIIIGEGQTFDNGGIARNRLSIFTNLHVWKRDEALTGVKLIASVIRTACAIRRLVLESGYHCVDCRVASTHFVRDPDGEFCHGIVTLEALVEVAP